MQSRSQSNRKIEYVGVMFRFGEHTKESAPFAFGKSGLALMRIILWSIEKCLCNKCDNCDKRSECNRCNKCRGYYFVWKLSYVDINLFRYSFSEAYHKTLEKAVDPNYLHKVLFIKTEVIERKYFRVILINGGVYLILEGEIIDPSIFKPEPLNWMVLPSSNQIKIKCAKIVRYRYLDNKKHVDLANKYGNDPTPIFLILILWLDPDLDLNTIKEIDQDLADILKC
jgi:hypothetical protein